MLEWAEEHWDNVKGLVGSGGLRPSDGWMMSKDACSPKDNNDLLGNAKGTLLH